MEVWFRWFFLFNWMIFMFHDNFPGVTTFSPAEPRGWVPVARWKNSVPEDLSYSLAGCSGKGLLCNSQQHIFSDPKWVGSFSPGKSWMIGIYRKMSFFPRLSMEMRWIVQEIHEFWSPWCWDTPNLGGSGGWFAKPLLLGDVFCCRYNIDTVHISDPWKMPSQRANVS